MKHLVPGHAVLAAVQREDVVAATLLLPNPATNNPVHVHAYRSLLYLTLHATAQRFNVPIKSILTRFVLIIRFNIATEIGRADLA